MQPVVSVVIPSRNRPQLVSRAVKSALAQTYKAIEVIVIVDGPDRDTVQVIEAINDSRLRVIELPVNVGPAGARNAGVREAKGTWIAFLDDDDEWLPQKIERQLEVANHSRYAFPIIASRFIARSSKGDFIWPKKLISNSENISDYLFVRNSLFMGEKFIATPTLLTKKELLQKIPFNNLRRHEDWDWLLRSNQLADVGIEFAPEELCVCSMQLNRNSLSSTSNWKYSLDWIRSVRELITPLAYSAFIVIEVIPQASSEGSWKVFLLLLWDILKFGKPRPVDFLLYFAMWLFPQNIRQQIRYFFIKKQPQHMHKPI
ncbi:glycosyltransferase family 2 protein [Scytonema millei VB511283]|uniref:Glycosyltransferase family 2 protein n=1 Tax=Scytonema millei VB511283 TaxID=1245923 RepID=A0A9X5I6U0_9CYAN|nr:glycosyltransferase family 2 protein [Scytonema millei VB511283]